VIYIKVSIHIPGMPLTADGNLTVISIFLSRTRNTVQVMGPIVGALVHVLNVVRTGGTNNGQVTLVAQRFPVCCFVPHVADRNLDLPVAYAKYSSGNGPHCRCIGLLHGSSRVYHSCTLYSMFSM
jgi:hypothetical protein